MWCLSHLYLPYTPLAHLWATCYQTTHRSFYILCKNIGPDNLPVLECNRRIHRYHRAGWFPSRILDIARRYHFQLSLLHYYLQYIPSSICYRQGYAEAFGSSCRPSSPKALQVPRLHHLRCCYNYHRYNNLEALKHGLVREHRWNFQQSLYRLNLQVGLEE